MALGSTQPLIELSTRNIPGGEGRPARKADNLTAICEPIVCKNVGASTSHSPIGLHGPLQGYLYLYLNNFTLFALFSTKFFSLHGYYEACSNHFGVTAALYTQS
jgi:hypothetical protein